MGKGWRRPEARRRWRPVPRLPLAPPRPAAGSLVAGAMAAGASAGGAGASVTSAGLGEGEGAGLDPQPASRTAVAAIVSVPPAARRKERSIVKASRALPRRALAGDGHPTQCAPSRACQPFANRGWSATGGRCADCARAWAAAEALQDPVRR